MKKITFTEPNGRTFSKVRLHMKDGRVFDRALYGYSDTRSLTGCHGCMVNVHGWEFLPSDTHPKNPIAGFMPIYD